MESGRRRYGEERRWISGKRKGSMKGKDVSEKRRYCEKGEGISVKEVKRGGGEKDRVKGKRGLIRDMRKRKMDYGMEGRRGRRRNG